RRIEWFEQNPHGWAKIDFGPDFGVALDKKGHIFVWGEGSPDGVPVGPVAVDLQGEAKGLVFDDAQCSSTKVFALTRRGQVVVFEGVLEDLRSLSKAKASSPAGPDRPLQLSGRLMPGLPQPTSLSFGGTGIKQMDIGLEHAAFVTFRGQVYTVGGNEWGQCGVRPPRQKGPMGALEERQRMEVEEPVLVQFPETAAPIVSVVVGGRHTVCTDATRRTWAFGDDRRIQLGLGDTRTAGNDERNAYGVLHQ
ncbi:unnamed protein product, partial [Prorocentrum cordatum]